MAEDASKNKTSGSDLKPDSSTSAFRIYALGTVAADLPMKSLDEDPNQTLEVFLDEIFSGADGKVAAKGVQNEVKGKDGQGREYNAKAATTSSVPCFWLPFGTNRMTAPCMRVGMRVVLWRTADEEQLYWEPKGGDDVKMSQERVIHTFQADPDLKSNKKVVDVNKCWYFEVDTFRSRFMFGTSQAAGEVTRLFIEGDLSAGNGFLRIADDGEQNLFLLHFMEHMLRYQNKDGSMIDVTRENIHMQCEDSISAIATKNLNFQAGQNINMKAGKAITQIAGTNMQLQCQNFTAQVATAAVWKCPSTTFTGNVNFTGEDGNSVRLNGDFHHESGTWRSPSGTNVYTHDHGGVERGNGNTDPFR